MCREKTCSLSCYVFNLNDLHYLDETLLWGHKRLILPPLYRELDTGLNYWPGMAFKGHQNSKLWIVASLSELKGWLSSQKWLSGSYWWDLERDLPSGFNYILRGKENGKRRLIQFNSWSLSNNHNTQKMYFYFTQVLPTWKISISNLIYATLLKIFYLDQERDVLFNLFENVFAWIYRPGVSLKCKNSGTEETLTLFIPS